MTSALLPQLQSIVGATHVLSSGDLSAFERDWRGRMQGKALCVVKPSSTNEVAQVVKACAAAGAPMVPQGGNTGLVMGSTPDQSGREVVLNLQRLNRIRAVDKANLTLTAEAGCVLQHVQQAATEAGLLFPLSLASEGSCTLGGNLGSNAGGTQVLRYGNTRDLCLGLEVVTAQGEVWHGLSGLRKDNTGYGLRDLFIGSEGTLGIITAATLKLYPQPAAELTAWAALPSMQAAVQLLGLAQQHLGAGLTGFEVMGQFALQLVHTHFTALHVPLWQTAPYCVLLSHSDTESEAHGNAQLERLLEAAISNGYASDAVVASSLAQGRQLWQVRESISSAQAAEGLNIKHDISLPVSAIPDFVAHTDALLAQEIAGVRLVNFGHLGDGNLHYNVQCPVGTDAAVFLANQEHRINSLVYEAVMKFGGSISAEHGVGSLKADTLHLYKDPVALQMMRSIKQALDPQNLMNPGRVLANSSNR
jgi:FAD/FMN-containing dehydrogenase